MQTVTLYEEKELLEAASLGDRRAFGKLYVNYLDDLSHYVYLFTGSEFLADEIVQDVFVRIWENKEKISSLHSFKSYLFRVAKNMLVDHVRHLQVKHKVHSDLRDRADMHSLEVDNAIEFKEYYTIAQHAIDQLPEKRKLIFRLSTQQGLSLDEIAEQLNISKFVVKKQLYAANDFVRRYLQERGDISLGLLSLLFFSC